MQGSTILRNVCSFTNYFSHVTEHLSFSFHSYVWITVSGTIPYGPAQISDTQAQIPVKSIGAALGYLRAGLGPSALTQTNML